MEMHIVTYASGGHLHCDGSDLNHCGSVISVLFTEEDEGEHAEELTKLMYGGRTWFGGCLFGIFVCKRAKELDKRRCLSGIVFLVCFLVHWIARELDVFVFGVEALFSFVAFGSQAS